MGLAGGPHCLAMCGAACVALNKRCGGQQPQRAALAWQLGRLLAYSLAGAVVASSVALMAQWGRELAWLKPWWVMLHVGAFALGLWMAWHGRAPLWMASSLQPSALAAAPVPAAVGGGGGSVVFSRLASATVPVEARPAKVLWLRAAGVGTAWVALPCGLLHSALVVAALGSSAWEGALVMACFAIGSGVSLWIGPAMWTWLAERAGQRGGISRLGPTQAVRLAGVMLAIGSGWAVGHQVLAPWVIDLCS